MPLPAVQKTILNKMFGEFAASTNSPNISFLNGVTPPGGHKALPYAIARIFASFSCFAADAHDYGSSQPGKWGSAAAAEPAERLSLSKWTTARGKIVIFNKKE